MRPAKRILGINILKNMSNYEMKLHHTPYLNKVLAKFSMEIARIFNVPLSAHFKLSSDQCPSNEQKKEEMASTPYTSAI